MKTLTVALALLLLAAPLAARADDGNGIDVSTGHGMWEPLWQWIEGQFKFHGDGSRWSHNGTIRSHVRPLYVSPMWPKL